MTTEPGTGTQPTTMTTNGLKIAMASNEVYCERWPDEGHSWSYTSHAGQPRVTTRRCHGCGYLSVQPVRELLARYPEELIRQLDSVSSLPAQTTVAGLRAQLAVVEKQRDKAQEHAVELVEQRDGARRLSEDMAAAWRKTRDERDEARGQRDALVAEVERIAAKIYTPEFFQGYLVDSSLRHWRQGITAELREAIAKTAPQPPAETQPQESIEWQMASYGVDDSQVWVNEGGIHDRNTRGLPVGGEATITLSPEQARAKAAALMAVAGEQPIADWELHCIEHDALRAERDAAVKARNELADASASAINKLAHDLGQATTTIAVLRAANDEQAKVHAITLGSAEAWNTKANELERDLAEARAETQRVRDTYRAHNQRLRDAIEKHADADDRSGWHLRAKSLRALLADTAQAAAGTTRDNNGGSE